MAHSTPTYSTTPRKGGVDPYAPPRHGHRSPARKNKSSGFMRNRDLAAEGHVMAIGAIMRIISFLALLLCLPGLFLSLAAGGPAFLMAVATVALLAFMVAVGHQLFQLRSWARIAFGVLSALQLLNAAVSLAQNPGGVVVVGTLVGGAYCAAQLWALFGEAGSRVFDPDYVEARERDGRSVAWWKSPFALIPAVICGIVILGALVTLARVL